MSVTELQQEIDKLAKIVTQKNLELEALKEEYSTKLELINRYIETLPHQLDTPTQITNDEFLKLLHLEVKCPNCRTIVHSNTEGEYVLIPKQSIQLSTEEVKTQRTMSSPVNQQTMPSPVNQQTMPSPVNQQTMPSPVNQQTMPSPVNLSERFKIKPIELKSKKNVSCSYCKESGHTRAKCNLRLSTPKKDAI